MGVPHGRAPWVGPIGGHLGTLAIWQVGKLASCHRGWCPWIIAAAAAHTRASLLGWWALKDFHQSRTLSLLLLAYLELLKPTNLTTQNSLRHYLYSCLDMPH